MWGFISRLSILFLWSLYLSLCLFHTVLVTVILWWVLNPGRKNLQLCPPSPSKIVLIIWGPMEVFNLAAGCVISWKAIDWEEWKPFQLFYKFRYEVNLSLSILVAVELENSKLIWKIWNHLIWFIIVSVNEWMRELKESRTSPNFVIGRIVLK